jgi:SPP1 gp7 family putative phage head morphogenesis protein
MTPVEQELARQRARLHAIEARHVTEIRRSYATVAARLAHHLTQLTALIDRATARGVEVRPGWLFAQARYRTLIADLQQHTDQFLADTAATIATGQKEAVQDAFQDGRRLAKLALGPAPKDAIAHVTDGWNRLPAAALDTFIGRAQDGSALGDLLSELSPLAPRQVKDTLAFGVAAGKNPRVIAREVQQAAHIVPNRALVIARNEIVQAHRQAVDETWKATGVVRSWRWRCARDARTCAACWAMDDTEHPVDEPLGSHPQCRCGRIPVTVSWADLGLPGVPDRRPVLPSGPDAFAALSEADKLAVLGRARLDAYNNGEIGLSDMVQRTRSPRWGNGIRVKALAAGVA